MRFLLFTFFLFLGLEASSQQTYTIGEKVEVDVEGVWFDAYIIEIDGKKFKVNYQPNSDEKDFWVKESRVRKKPVEGGGKIEIEWATTVQKPEKEDKKKNTNEEQVESKLVKITLHNTCRHRQTFIINDDTYEIDPNKKMQLEVKEGTSIYILSGDKKVIKGKATERINTFLPNCD